MKKIIIAVALFLCAFLAPAQVSVSSGNLGVDVKVKRAIAVGSDVYVDLVFTIGNSWKQLEIHTRNDMGEPGVRFYDDEGQLYQSGSNETMQFDVDGKISYWYPKLIVEKNVPRKMRIIIKNVDEYATMFSSVRVPYLGENDRNIYVITIKNLPITRQ